jgi:hypothetical protein
MGRTSTCVLPVPTHAHPQNLEVRREYDQSKVFRDSNDVDRRGERRIDGRSVRRKVRSSGQ